MNRKIVDGFAIAGVIAAFISVYIGWRQLTDPGTVVQGVDRLIENSERQIDVSEGIRDALVPADAVESLSKRGYKVDRSGFRQALEIGDEQAIGLFCQAVSNPIVDSYGFFTDVNLSDDIGKILERYPAVDLRKICSFSVHYGVSNQPLFRYKPDVSVQLCGQAAFDAGVKKYEFLNAAYEAEMRENCEDKNKEIQREAGEGQLGLHIARNAYKVLEIGRVFLSTCRDLGVPITKP